MEFQETSKSTTSGEFVQYFEGNIPCVICAPHGGTLRPQNIPNRTSGCMDEDWWTIELVNEVLKQWPDVSVNCMASRSQQLSKPINHLIFVFGRMPLQRFPVVHQPSKEVTHMLLFACSTDPKLMQIAPALQQPNRLLKTPLPILLMRCGKPTTAASREPCNPH